MGWITTDRKPCNCGTADRLESHYRVENGYMTYSGALEEYTKEQQAAVTVFELSSRCGGRQGEPIHIPNGGFIQALVSGEPLNARTDHVLAHSQGLDLTHAVLFRRTIFSTTGGGMALIRSRRFASLTHPHLLCQEYIVQSSREVSLVIQAGIDGDVWALNGPCLVGFNMHSQDGILSLTTQVQPNGVPVTVSAVTLLPRGTRIVVQKEKRALEEITVQAAAYQPVVITRLVAVYTGVDSADPLAEGRNLCGSAGQLGFEKLYRSHCELWEKHWREDVRLGRELRKQNRTYRLPDAQDLC